MEATVKSLVNTRDDNLVQQKSLKTEYRKDEVVCFGFLNMVWYYFHNFSAIISYGLYCSDIFNKNEKFIVLMF